MKICLAGTGAMGEIHVKALKKIDDVQVVAVAGRTDAGVKEFAEKWNIPYSSTNLEECIDRPGVDAVLLTTPSDQHHDQTVLAPVSYTHLDAADERCSVDLGGRR